LKPRLNKAYVDDAKLTDHHAIIPTYNDVPSSLPERQKNIYKLVATRFMTIFLPPEIRDETTAFIKILEYSFRAKGFVIKDAGWTKADPQKKEKEPEKKEKGKAGAKAKDKGDAEESQQLPPLNKGQDVDKRAEELKSGKTTPPKPYDDGSLLTAMKNIGKEMDDEDLAAYMKQRGLGTPATRAAIIERLIKSGYIERQKKAIVPTEKGKALISQVHGDLKDVALTATWEQSLADMQDGKLLLNKFENDIGEFVRRILPEVTKRTAALPRDGEESWGQCPQCKVGFVKPTPKGAGCSQWREGCNFSIWRECFGATLSDEHMKDLIKDKRTKLIKGFKKKSGEGTYDARLKVNEEFKVRLDFDP